MAGRRVDGVTRALQNLTHRESDEDPAALVPGEPFTATVRSTRPAMPSRPGTASGWRLAHLLAVGVAVAGARDPDALRRRERARAAGARAAARGRQAAGVGSARGLEPMPKPRCSVPAPRGGGSPMTFRRPGRALVRLGGRRGDPAAERPRDLGPQLHRLLHRRGRPAVGARAVETAGAIGRGDWRTRCEGLGDDLRRGLVPRQEHGPGLGGDKPAYERTFKRTFPRDLV